MTAEECFRRKTDVLWTAWSGGAVLHLLRNGSYVFLNQWSLQVWQLCDGLHDVERIAKHMGSLNGDGARTKARTARTIRFLTEHHLVERIDAPRLRCGLGIECNIGG